MITTEEIIREYREKGIITGANEIQSIKAMNAGQLRKLIAAQKGSNLRYLVDGDFPGIILDNRALTYTCFINCQFPKTIFRPGFIHRSGFAQCDLTEAEFRCERMETVWFRQCQTDRMNLNPDKAIQIVFEGDRDMIITGHRKWKERTGYFDRKEILIDDYLK